MLFNVTLLELNACSPILQPPICPDVEVNSPALLTVNSAVPVAGTQIVPPLIALPVIVPEKLPSLANNLPLVSTPKF